jgi:hypothetical protein
MSRARLPRGYRRSTLRSHGQQFQSHSNATNSSCKFDVMLYHHFDWRHARGAPTLLISCPGGTSSYLGLGDLVAGQFNQGSMFNVQHVHVSFPSRYCKHGVTVEVSCCYSQYQKVLRPLSDILMYEERCDVNVATIRPNVPRRKS